MLIEIQYPSCDERTETAVTITKPEPDVGYDGEMECDPDECQECGREFKHTDIALGVERAVEAYY